MEILTKIAMLQIRSSLQSWQLKYDYDLFLIIRTQTCDLNYWDVIKAVGFH